MLKFYDPTEGEILLGNSNLTTLSPSFWRSKCGMVMQDGYIFSDTLSNNIAITEGQPDHIQIRHASKTANITDFVDKLPLGYN